MIPVVIALVRNALCVCKSLFPVDWTVMSPRFPSKFGSFTYLEAAIGLLQLSGGIINLYKGLKSLYNQLAEGASIVRWRNAVAATPGEEAAMKDKQKEKVVLLEVLEARDAANSRVLAVSLCLLVIGAGLICLGLFSYKLITLHTVVCAVAALELPLMVLLPLSLESVWDIWQASSTLMASGVSTSTFSSTCALWGDFIAGMGQQWKPRIDKQPTGANIRRELHEVGRLLEEGKHQLDQNSIQKIVKASRQRAVLDFVLYLLNVVAFWGYMLIPLTYFYRDEFVFRQWVPSWPGHDVAAWWGNLAGDVAWSIEPSLILLTPIILGCSKLQKTKVD